MNCNFSFLLVFLIFGALVLSGCSQQQQQAPKGNEIKENGSNAMEKPEAAEANENEPPIEPETGVESDGEINGTAEENNGVSAENNEAADEPSAVPDQNSPETGSEQNLEPETGAEPPAAEIKEFTITAKNWEFEPSTITVNKGDTVKLNIKSVDIEHGFTLSEFNVRENLEPGKTVSVEFVADKSGSFTFFCSVFCGSGHSGMRGTLVVN